MKKMLLIILIIAELLIFILLYIRINIKKYDNWSETNAIVIDVNVFNAKNGFRSNQSTNCFVWIDYLDVKNNDLRFVNYKNQFRKNDNLSIKYNPDNKLDIIYPPYEEHRIKTERRNIILFFAALILGTLIFYYMVLDELII